MAENNAPMSRCECGIEFVKAGKRIWCSDRCRDRIYHQKWRAGFRARGRNNPAPMVKLRAWRLDRKWTQAMMARASGVLAPEISRIETTRLTPTLGQRNKLARLTGIRPYELQDQADPLCDGPHILYASGPRVTGPEVVLPTAMLGRLGFSSNKIDFKMALSRATRGLG